jgi:alpha-amylase/alpha-mannosidase (GH57 family)
MSGTSAPTTTAVRALAAAIVLVLVASGCTTSPADTTLPQATTTTSVVPGDEPLDPDGFYLMLMWHHHQPLYPPDADGVVTRPWVRVHATKDYYDMAAMVEEFPEIRVTFNLTPVLLLQLEALATGTKDLYWALAEIPADLLTVEQQDFIRERFFDTNPRVVARFPRYRELADRRAAGEPFTVDDYRDLQVLFNLAWTDPDFLEVEPLASLVAKGRGFSEEDKQVVFEEHLRIIREVIPIHTRLWESGQIEVTTTPLAHPILPLIADTSLASLGDPGAVLPAHRFQEIPDATEHVQRGLEVAERLLGRRPVGMWPAEGAVAQLVMSLFSREGVQWVATGEHVLAQSLGIGGFTRDAADTVVEADLLYRPWNATLRRHPPVAMFFRDLVLSDLIGFQYSGTQAEAAADDFMRRLADIKGRLDETGAQGPHVVSVILDGENAWEHYPNDGKDFLRALYGALSDADWVRTVTPSQYLDAFAELIEPLDEVFPAAWFSPNFATWIGEEEEALAWDYLWRARRDLHEAERSGAFTAVQLEAAFESMLFAQGSDWFWWFGDDQDSGQDDYFDAAFRELLGQMYDALGRPRPAWVSVPIIPETPLLADRSPDGLITVTVDDVISDDEWAPAGYFEGAGGERLWFGFDRQNLFLRLDFGDLGGDGVDLYLGSRSGTRRAVTEGGSLLGFGAGALWRWSVDDPRRAGFAPSLPEEAGAFEFAETLAVGFDGERLETAIPLELLGPMEVGDRIVIRPVARADGRETVLGRAPLLVQVPDISDVDLFLEVTDPAGDDHGPGTYTYPRDEVFIPGSYDLLGFSAGVSGDDLVFTFDVAAPIHNPWGSPVGLSVQTFDVYIDVDPGAGTGRRILIPGRNAALEPGNGWEYALTVEGWDSALYVARSDGSIEETKPSFRVIVLGDRGRVVVRLPRALFGDGDPAQWGYAVALLSQEGFPSSGVRRVRDVEPTAQQWRLGGGPVDVNHTRIIDLLWPESGVQEAMLSGYPPVTGRSIDEVTADELPQVPMVVP